MLADSTTFWVFVVVRLIYVLCRKSKNTWIWSGSGFRWKVHNTCGSFSKSWFLIYYLRQWN